LWATLQITLKIFTCVSLMTIPCGQNCRYWGNKAYWYLIFKSFEFITQSLKILFPNKPLFVFCCHRPVLFSGGLWLRK